MFPIRKLFCQQHIPNYLRLVESAPRITVHTLDTAESCTHEVAVPPDQEYTPLSKPPGEPAKTYPFTLDPFQEEVNFKKALSLFSKNQIIKFSFFVKLYTNIYLTLPLGNSLHWQQSIRLSVSTYISWQNSYC